MEKVDKKESGANIYFSPNPFNSKLVVNSPASCELSIYDIAGRLLYFGKVRNGKDIDCINFPTGLLIYRLQGSGFVKTGKIIHIK